MNGTVKKVSLDVAEAAHELMLFDDILIVTHTKPDGDTSGTGAALCSALRRCGKNASLYANPGFTPRLLSYISPMIVSGEFKWKYAVSVDLADVDMFPEGFSGEIDLCIDHHPSNPLFGKKNCVFPERASCAEVVLGIIEALTGSPSPYEANLLYIGLSTDCGCFRFGNTDESAHLAAAKLIAAGADIYALNQEFFEKRSMARIRLEGLLYSAFEFYYDGAVAFSLLSLEMLRKTGAVEDDLDSIASLPISVDGVELSVTIREQPNGTSKVSVRSGKSLSSAELCAAFGGGGHYQASGCTISEDIETAKKLLLGEIDRRWGSTLCDHVGS